MNFSSPTSGQSNFGLVTAVTAQFSIQNGTYSSHGATADCGGAVPVVSQPLSGNPSAGTITVTPQTTWKSGLPCTFRVTVTAGTASAFAEVTAHVASLEIAPKLLLEIRNSRTINIFPNGGWSVVDYEDLQSLDLRSGTYKGFSGLSANFPQCMTNAEALGSQELIRPAALACIQQNPFSKCAFLDKNPITGDVHLNCDSGQQLYSWIYDARENSMSRGASFAGFVQPVPTAGVGCGANGNCLYAFGAFTANATLPATVHVTAADKSVRLAHLAIPAREKYNEPWMVRARGNKAYIFSLGRSSTAVNGAFPSVGASIHRFDLETLRFDSGQTPDSPLIELAGEYSLTPYRNGMVVTDDVLLVPMTLRTEAGFSTRLYAFDTRTGSRVPQKEMPLTSIPPFIAASATTLYLLDNNNLRAFNLDTMTPAGVFNAAQLHGRFPVNTTIGESIVFGALAHSQSQGALFVLAGRSEFTGTPYSGSGQNVILWTYLLRFDAGNLNNAPVLMPLPPEIRERSTFADRQPVVGQSAKQLGRMTVIE